ncbi:hypothetical protein BOX15_Mlig015244g1 [Macrostomum lignano]|uniref:RGS domain-containing protein n=1 Tax=Macrostomum lignano TaxID=282301 RepID=A0A267EJY5_9PLAT|nr:hypothetical protein BOX15_Mlig015244g4 [Macrostomum lignano]PAA50950.1 hypothetical protein BOX15_Mlig015244g3 [Macrostomum lignano]PAA61217.1 hypothetical protein BOX15_Mlig015244g2 [Macrostomum lignano]PAA72122.1 hypothetical protein BOX15_Mlig015244g1 [Macrostomum lignano]
MTLVNCASDVSEDEEGRQVTDHQQQQQQTVGCSSSSALDNWRHTHVVTKLEAMVQAMQHPQTGVTFRAQKAFLTSVPAAVAGSDLIAWVRRYTGAEEPTEANHIASLLAIYGYVYPLSDDYSLAVRDDPSCLYRFQSPYYWLSISGRPDNLDYAIHLVKRMIRSKQKPGFEDFEKLALSKLQKLLADRWQFIALQAEEELKLLRERKKNDRMVLEMQEQAYWRVHRPPPGYINSVDHPVPRHFSLTQTQNRLAKQRRRRQHKESLVSSQNAHHKSGETIIACYEISKAFDWFLHTRPAAPGTAGTMAQQPANGSNSAAGTAGAGPAVDTSFTEADHSGGPSSDSAALTSGQSPWVGDDVAVFQNSLGYGESGLTPKQVKMWSAYFDFLLRDAAGREYFKQFLTKEFSSENLSFWLAVQDYKFGPNDQLRSRMTQIFDEFLAPGAPSEINIDSKTMTITQKGMQSPNRFSFEEAQEHIYLLMKKDSYQRFLRSDDYKTLLQSAIERHAMKKRGALFNFGKKAAQPTSSCAAHPTVTASISQRGKVETQSSLEASSSSGTRVLKTRPVDQAGPSGCEPVANKASAGEVAPWETEAASEKKPDSSTVTPWEDG